LNIKARKKKALQLILMITSETLVVTKFQINKRFCLLISIRVTSEALAVAEGIVS